MNIDEKKLLEEHLREAVSVGDINLVQELIQLGVDVNSRNSVNGWTPLHWACKRNYHDIVILLLKNGADKNIKSEKGETPASVSSNPYISHLLNAPLEYTFNSNQDSTLVPNYLQDNFSNRNIQLPFPCETINTLQPNLIEELSLKEQNKQKNAKQEEIVLKIRIANAFDPDFIEVDLFRDNLSYESLIKTCCDELEITATQILKIRKLPNTKIRRDKDVQRLENYQEIEVVLYSQPNLNDGNKSIQQANGNALPITPTNNYQSISKKDQTILY